MAKATAGITKIHSKIFTTEIALKSDQESGVIDNASPHWLFSLDCQIGYRTRYDGMRDRLAVD